MAKLSDKWTGLPAKLLTIYPPFKERSGQAVGQVEWTAIAKLLTIYPPFKERSGQAVWQVEGANSQAAHYLSSF